MADDLQGIREQFVLKRLVTGQTDQQIADEWNRRYTDDEAGIVLTAATVRLDRVRLMESMAESHKETLDHVGALLYARVEQVYRVLSPKLEEGHLGAAKLWLEAIREQATLTGANAPVKIARTDAAGQDLLDDKQRTEAILDLMRRARERQLTEMSSNGYMIDVTPPPP